MDQHSYSCEFFIFNFFPKNFRLLAMYFELQSGFVLKGALVGILENAYRFALVNFIQIY